MSIQALVPAAIYTIKMVMSTIDNCWFTLIHSFIRDVYDQLLLQTRKIYLIFQTEKTKRNHLEKLHLKTSMQCQMFASENAVMRKKILELEMRLKVSTSSLRFILHVCLMFVFKMKQ